MTLSTIGVLAFGVLGAWVFGGVVLRLTGGLIALAGLLGLGSTGDANGIVVFTLGAWLWLAGHLHFQMRHAVFKSALAEWLRHAATSTWRCGLDLGMPRSAAMTQGERVSSISPRPQRPPAAHVVSPCRPTRLVPFRRPDVFMRSERRLAQKISNRRAPGEVRDAIVAALRSKPKGASVQEIQTAVEKKLGDPVAPSSIRSLLRLRTDSSQPLFARTGRGRYKLVRR